MIRLVGPVNKTDEFTRCFSAKYDCIVDKLTIDAEVLEVAELAPDFRVDEPTGCDV